MKAVDILIEQRSSLGGESGRPAPWLRLRGERKLGKLLRRMADTGERVTGRPEKVSQGATLSYLGSPRHRTSRAMQLAEVPEEQFERQVKNDPDKTGRGFPSAPKGELRSWQVS